MNEEYADLFCELFDRLDPAEFQAEGEAWMGDAKVAATAARVEQAALDGEPVGAPEGGRQTFAVLLGLDAALAHANSLSGAAAPPALTEYALRYAESAASTPVPFPARSCPASPARAAAANCPTTWPTPSARWCASTLATGMPAITPPCRPVPA